MNGQIDWSNRKYVMGRVDEYCRNENCDWRQTGTEETGYEELEICPVCGEETDSSITFGGLVVHYNRVKDNFTLKSPYDERHQAYVDNADCPDAILFMLRHFRFNGWAV